MGEIDHDPRPQRFAGQARARAAGVNRVAVLAGIAYCGHHVVGRTRPDHRQGTQLVQAGVIGVHLGEEVVAAHVAFEESPQILFNALALLVHGLILTRSVGERPR